LVFVDLDGLKTINDSHGHQAGDQALCDIARVLKRTFRESDLLARLGGDEFAVLAVDTPSASTDAVVTRLQETLRGHNAGRTFALSLSEGIAHYSCEPRPSIDKLLAQADARMYERKRGRRIP
jgi:two-component system cell cycle response regulator